MKVVYVIGKCSSGGAEALVKDQLLELKKNPLISEVSLWVMLKLEDDIVELTKSRLEFEKKYIEILKGSGIKVVNFEKRVNKDIFKTWIKIRKLYSIDKPDIIHSHLFNPTFHVVMSLFGKKTKIFQTIHSTTLNKNHKKIQKFLIRFFITKFISISDEVTETIRELKVKDKNIVKIENGINLKRFKNDRVKTRKISNIVSIGRLTNVKNYQLMLNSYKNFKEYLIKNKKEIPTLNIVGDGEEKENLENLIYQLGMNKEVKMLGLRGDIPKILKESHLYLMSSRWEGLSISLIEAAAAGIPILATNVGSNHYVLKNNAGILTKNDSVEKFTENLIKIYENHDLRNSISKQAILNSERFDIETNVKKLVDLYKETLGKGYEKNK